MSITLPAMVIDKTQCWQSMSDKTSGKRGRAAVGTAGAEKRGATVRKFRIVRREGSTAGATGNSQVGCRGSAAGEQPSVPKMD